MGGGKQAQGAALVFSTDLTFYIKGGRVTKTAGFVGTMLSICPLLHVNYEGKLIPVQKVRTKKKVIEAIGKKDGGIGGGWSGLS